MFMTMKEYVTQGKAVAPSCVFNSFRNQWSSVAHISYIWLSGFNFTEHTC